MKAEILKRLFRAVSLNSPDELDRLCSVVVEDERKKGHDILAHQLESILATGVRDRGENVKERNLNTLPRAKRTDNPLVSFRPTETLRHEMVLSPGIERRFQTVENEYAARDRLNRFGLQHKRRILLYGPPGCGKSLGAERLGYNTGLPFFRVRFDTLLSSMFGESAQNLRQVFSLAAERPCLLLLDECDFIARSRRSTNDVGEIPRIVNTLLQLMEEFEGSGLVVATTNLSGELDEALFRRFDDVFEVPLPERAEVDRLLRQAMLGLEYTRIDFCRLTERIQGQSAAEIVKVAQDSCKLAILSGRTVLTEDDVSSALSSQFVPLTGRN
jgi:SpoVK/Ycf46/Vps4 family AAA+-type ATPase